MMFTAKELITGEEKSFSDLLLENLKMNRLVEELEEILKEEENLRKGKELYYCLCHATTGTVCTICKVHMDLDHDSLYASCDPSCKIANLTKDKLIELSHSRAQKSNPKGTKDKFVTFTRPSNLENDYIKLFDVLKYIKKAKAVHKFYYSFEYQKNGNPHLHTILILNEGYYFRDIARTLIKTNAGGYTDEQTRRGTIEEGIKYLTKDIDNTAHILSTTPINYFLLHNIQLTNANV